MNQLPIFAIADGTSPPKARHRLLPSHEQPAGRVLENPTRCTTLELLAALLGGSQPIELAEAVLTGVNGQVPDLARLTAAELARIPGIGPVNAARIKAACELGVRLSQPGPQDRQVIHTPADAAALVLHEMSLLQQEHLRVILLDTRNRVMEIAEIYRGSLNSAPVRVAELYRPAIQRMSAGMIAVHNHPSGAPRSA